MAMTIRTMEDRFANLLALHQLVDRIEENNQGELEFLVGNPTLNTFMKDMKAYMADEKKILADEIAKQALVGEFTLMDSIKTMTGGDSDDIE